MQCACNYDIIAQQALISQKKMTETQKNCAIKKRSLLFKQIVSKIHK